MDHASELEIIPLSSGIDDNDIINRPKSHPFAEPLHPEYPHHHLVEDLKKILHLEKLNNNNNNNNNHLPNQNINNHKKNKHKITSINQIKNSPLQKHHNHKEKRTGDESSISKSSLFSLSPKQHNFIKIIAPSMAFFGCQFAWACQGGYVDPYLRRLGLANDMMNYAWILGPLSGMIFQPMIGVFSDHCESKFGRRRPYFLSGAFILTICLWLFSHSMNIGYDIFNDATTHIALIIAFICFWLLDFSTNFMEGPLRALCSDTLNETEQLQSNSWFGIMNGLASTLGFALGYMTNDIRIIFGIAAFVVIISSMATSILVDEKKHIDHNKHHNNDSIELAQQMSTDEELGDLSTSNNSQNNNIKDQQEINNNEVIEIEDNNNNNYNNNENINDAVTIPNGVYVNHLSPLNESTIHQLTDHRDNEQSNCIYIKSELKDMMFGLFHMPSIVSRCWIVQFCTYFSNFACWVYLTDYFGENIMGGDASSDVLEEKELYSRGVQYGNLAFCFIAGISAVFSFLATRLVGMFGLKRLWIFCLLTYSFVMLISPLLSNLTIALLLFSLAGLPMGASFTLPWAVVSSYSTKKDPNNAGLWLTSLNIAECGPELTVGLLGGIIVDRFNGNVSSVFFIAGIVNLIAAVLVLQVDTSVYDGNEGKYGFVNVDDNISPQELDIDENEEIIEDDDIFPNDDEESNTSAEDNEV